MREEWLNNIEMVDLEVIFMVIHMMHCLFALCLNIM